MNPNNNAYKAAYDSLFAKLAPEQKIKLKKSHETQVWDSETDKFIKQVIEEAEKNEKKGVDTQSSP